LLWSRAIGADAIAPAADGGFYLAMTVARDAGDTALAVLRLADDGTTVWSQTVPQVNAGVSTYLAGDPGGGVWVLGTQQMQTSGPGFNLPTFVGPFLARLDATGNVLWQEMLGQVATIYPRGLAVNPSGQAFVALDSNNGSFSFGTLPDGGTIDSGPIVASINPDGSASWVDVISQDYYTGIYSLALASDGTVYSAGTTAPVQQIGTSYDPQAFVTALDGQGNLLWQRVYANTSSAGDPLVAARPCGGLALVAAIDQNGYAVIDLNVSGDEIQRRTLNCAGQCRPSALAPAGADGLVLTGQFWGVAFAFGTLTLQTSLSTDSFILRISE
jgi:hypothetical protein